MSRVFRATLKALVSLAILAFIVGICVGSLAGCASAPPPMESTLCLSTSRVGSVSILHVTSCNLIQVEGEVKTGEGE